MREIPLIRGMVALVDDEDFTKLSQFKWSVSTINNNRYALTGKKDPIAGSTAMHRIIMNPPKGMEVDHIDGNGLNNQKSNLRVVTHWQNMCNVHSSNGQNKMCENLFANVCAAKQDSDCYKKSLTLKRKPTAYCHSVPVKS